MDEISTSHLLTDITICTYICTVRYNVKILIGSKAPSKLIVIVIIKYQRQTSIFHSGQHITCHKISQIALKNYNQFGSVRTGALLCIQFTTYLGKKLNIETDTQHRYQQLIDFILIGSMQVDKKLSSEQNIINISMDTIINISFNKTPMTWRLIYHHLLCPS